MNGWPTCRRGSTRGLSLPTLLERHVVIALERHSDQANGFVREGGGMQAIEAMSRTSLESG
jgi:hypothetical protein